MPGNGSCSIRMVPGWKPSFLAVGNCTPMVRQRQQQSSRRENTGETLSVSACACVWVRERTSVCVRTARVRHRWKSAERAFCIQRRRHRSSTTCSEPGKSKSFKQVLRTLDSGLEGLLLAETLAHQRLSQTWGHSAAPHGVMLSSSLLSIARRFHLKTSCFRYEFLPQN